MIITDSDWCGSWIAQRTGGQYLPGEAAYIGWVDPATDSLTAVSQFASCNGSSIIMHCAVDGGKLAKEFLWFSFYYPFIQLGLTKIISPVESTNIRCTQFITHIGFTLEATLKDAAPDGNLLLYTMSRDTCRWLTLKRKCPSGKAVSPSST